MPEPQTERDECGDRWNDMACTLPPGHAGMHVDERVFGSTAPESNLAMGTIDDERCHRCRGKNIRWSAPSPLWNRVMRGNDISGDPRYGDLVCIRCFIVLAFDEGIDGTWRVTVDPEPDGLIYETPSGRVWDRERGLWVDPREAEGDPLTAIRERLDALAIDLASATEEATSFGGGLIGAVNLYSDACDELREMLTPSGASS